MGALTIAVMFVYLILYAGMGAGSEGYVQSQFPMMAFIPFVLWLFLNTALARISPSATKSSACCRWAKKAPTATKWRQR